MPRPPASIEVYDRHFKFRGTVGDPTFLTVIPRFNAPGQINLGVRSNHRVVPDLMQDGAHVRIVDDADEEILSGWVNGFGSSGPEMSSVMTFNITDHLGLLRYILGWVVPNAPITGQGTAGTNWVRQGPAETVLKEALRQNGVQRLGLPIEVPASQGRGADVKASLRFQSLYERLFPVVDGAGIEKSGVGFAMRMVPGTGLRLDTFTPRVHAQPLTEESGIVTAWDYSYEAPTATRGVAGGQGEAQLRVFRESALAGLEQELAWKYEVFRDGRDTPDPTVLYERLQETFAESGRKAGFSVELSQTPRFRYGGANGLRVGDVMTIEVGGHRLTDTLAEATLSWTTDKGWESRPRVGDKNDSADAAIVKAIRAIARGITNRNTER